MRGIFARVRVAEAEGRILDLAGDDQVKFGLFLLVGIRPLEVLVTPLDGEEVIRTDLGDEGRVVSGLGNIVEPAVVHHRGLGAVLGREFLVPKLRHGKGRACLHVVGEPQCVADLVGDHIGQALADQVVGKGQGLGFGIVRRGLDEVPVADELEDVVVNQDVGLEDFACPRVVDMRSHRVFDRGGEPSDRGITGVLGIPFRVFTRGRGVLGDDRVLEPCLLEGGLPHLDALLDEGPPLGGNFPADVVDDLLLGLGDLGGGVFLLEPPASDVLDVFNLVVADVGEVLKARSEVADPAVELAGLHRLVGELHHAMVQEHRHVGPFTATEGFDGESSRSRRGRRVGAGAGEAGENATGGGAVGHGDLGLDVFRVRLDLLDEGLPRVGPRGVETTPGAELGDVAGEK